MAPVPVFPTTGGVSQNRSAVVRCWTALPACQLPATLVEQRLRARRKGQRLRREMRLVEGLLRCARYGYALLLELSAETTVLRRYVLYSLPLQIARCIGNSWVSDSDPDLRR